MNSLVTHSVRPSMVWLHGWVGLIVGWLLFAIFVTGSVSYFRHEINRWMRPEARLEKASLVHAAATAAGSLQDQASDASRWLIDLPDSRDPIVHIYAWWEDGRRPSFEHRMLDPATGAPVIARSTEGGDFLYYFHFDLRIPRNWGYWTTCAAAVAMLVALVSGVIAHRRIFADFFTFRSKPARRAWLDAHNVFGVLALPFHFMIAYSGVITLLFIYLPWGLEAAYPKDRNAFYAELQDTKRHSSTAGDAAPLVSMADIIKEASLRLGENAVGRIWIYSPGRAAIVEVEVAADSQVSEPLRRLRFDHDGTLLPMTPPPGPAAVTQGFLHGLHIAAFADPVLRWLFFLSGAMGSAVIATGLVLWTKKRRARIGATLGIAVVERLNVGVIVGLPVAIAVYFWANRLIPVGLADRAAWEANALFIAWAAMLLHAALWPAARAWLEQLWVAAALYGLLPVVNALTTNRHLGRTLPRGEWQLAGVDLAALAFGIGFALAAWTVGRRPRGRPAAGAATTAPMG